LTTGQMSVRVVIATGLFHLVTDRAQDNCVLAIWAQPASEKRPREQRARFTAAQRQRCQQPCKRRDGAHGAAHQQWRRTDAMSVQGARATARARRLRRLPTHYQLMSSHRRSSVTTPQMCLFCLIMQPPESQRVLRFIQKK